MNELREFAGRCAGGMGGDFLCHIADKIEAEVAERYVALPTDADGKPIYIGDVMERSDGETLDVSGIGMQSLFYVDDQSGHIKWTCAYDKRHYHAQTVEDMLQEMVVDWDCAPDGEDKAAVLKEYAAKLRLAGDDE